MKGHMPGIALKSGYTPVKKSGNKNSCEIIEVIISGNVNFLNLIVHSIYQILYFLR